MENNCVQSSRPFDFRPPCPSNIKKRKKKKKKATDYKYGGTSRLFSNESRDSRRKTFFLFLPEKFVAAPCILKLVTSEIAEEYL